MSRTFIASKRGDPSPSEVERLRDLWRLHYAGRLPRWMVLLWMRVHGWEAKPLVTFTGGSSNRGSTDDS